jgi:hypothetical protein
MKQASDGTYPVTVVDGLTYVGLFATDGSMNVVDATAETDYVGIEHSCGAMNVTIVDGATYVGRYAVNGSWNVIEDNDQSCGALPVTVVV